MSRSQFSIHPIGAWVGLGVLFLAGLATLAHGEEVIPPAPTRYFNDYAHVVSPAVGSGLNGELEQFERTTSNQLVVAIFPNLQTDSSLEDYCQRVYVAWKIGQKGNNNGAVLFVFLKEHKLRIHTGYGLEGALLDATCQRIIANEISPRFRQNDYDGGLTAGVHAMMAAAKGEYTGNGRTANDAPEGSGKSSGLPILFLLMVILVFFFLSRQSGGGTSYGRSGRSGGSGPSGCLGFLLGMMSSGGYGGGGGFGGGSFGGGGGGGGGFSGGGGDSGGGGASGSW